AIFAGDVERHPLLARRAAAYRAEGIRAMMVMPLRIAGEHGGTLVFYFRTPREFTESERLRAAALGNLAAAAIGAAELHDQQHRQHEQVERERQHAAELAQAHLRTEHTLRVALQAAGAWSWEFDPATG